MVLIKMTSKFPSNFHNLKVLVPHENSNDFHTCGTVVLLPHWSCLHLVLFCCTFESESIILRTTTVCNLGKL